jgi:hypothetical protein
MDREDNFHRQNLQEQDLPGLAKLCRNVANNLSVDRKQGDTAHALRVEWVRLSRNGWPHNGDAKAQTESLRRRMTEFLAGVPAWMMGGF